MILELAGLAEEEFGMDSNAMFNDLHAPSVPVHTNDGGQAAATTKVNLHRSFLRFSICYFHLGWCDGR